jgi:ABC-type multidrug transport system fused ATPase/permease subunit
VQSLRLAKAAIDVVFEEASYSFQGQSIEQRIYFEREIRFENVSFSYHGQSSIVLKALSLGVTFGESLGIVGPSGAGKTTLVDLLLGLLTPTSGVVTVDGKAVDLSKMSWRSEVGYVPQDVFLIDDTIRNNIAFGIPTHEISEERIRNCVETAQLKDFVSALPDGLDTVTGERGVRLSGGQRQRIGIARALYHEPTLLVLDEATSALDLDTETEFLETLEAIHKQVTMVVISHRLSSLKYCDRIVRLEHGALAEVR